MKKLRNNPGSPLRWLPATLLACVTSLIAVSCSQDECLTNRTTLPQCGFYAYGLTDQAIAIDSTAIFGLGAPEGALVLDSTTSASSVILPLRIDSDTTTFVLEYVAKAFREIGARDEVTFIYSRTPYFVSSACGVSYRYQIEKVEHTHFLLDSVGVPQPLITNVAMENIRLYFRVALPDDEEPSRR